jgi:hypothetical protein
MTDPKLEAVLAVLRDFFEDREYVMNDVASDVLNSLDRLPPPIEFHPWKKTARRWSERITITEKLDGTNAAVGVNDDGTEVWAQSRKRLITPDSDNFGFARWVHENAGVLADVLGPGLHFGEWWGQGIQRGYGLKEKRFSLFNTRRWLKDIVDIGVGADWQIQDQLYLVPVLADGVTNGDDTVLRLLRWLKDNGSMAAPGFERPEGICIFHYDSQVIEKAFDGPGLDETRKGA